MPLTPFIKAMAVCMSTAIFTLPVYAQYNTFDEAAMDRLMLLWLTIFALAALIYFIPTIVAFRRGHPNRWAILVINTVFGASGLGWLGSLIWALNAVHVSPTGNNGGESGLNLFVNDGGLGQTSAAPVGAGRPNAEPEVDRLEQLQRLYAQGALDDAEYASLRKAALYDAIGISHPKAG